MAFGGMVNPLQCHFLSDISLVTPAKCKEINPELVFINDFGIIHKNIQCHKQPWLFTKTLGFYMFIYSKFLGRTVWQRQLATAFSVPHLFSGNCLVVRLGWGFKVTLRGDACSLGLKEQKREAREYRWRRQPCLSILRDFRKESGGSA